MNNKSMDNFVKYLESEKIYKVNPLVLTLKEIVLYGRIHGFKISLDDVKDFIQKNNERPETEMNKVTINWRK